MATMTTHAQALLFIAAHAAEYLQGNEALLIDRTADHLVDQHEIGRDTAFAIASQAWGEYDGRRHPGWIDMSRTNSRCVVLHLEGGGTVALGLRHLTRAVALLARDGVTLPCHCPGAEAETK